MRLGVHIGYWGLGLGAAEQLETASRPRRARCRISLEGRRGEAAAALPAELIDAVTLCGPRAVVRDRLSVLRAAGVGTLMILLMAWSFEERRMQLRLVAELAA